MSATETSKRGRRRSVAEHPPEAPPRDQHAADVEADHKAFIRRMHENGSASALLHTSITVLYMTLAGLAVWTWALGLWPVTIAIWLLMGNIGHSKLIAFHESSHGTLNPRYLVNEVQGIFVGVIAHVPLSVYRYVHGQHHAHICSEDDLELWPFVNPEKAAVGKAAGRLQRDRVGILLHTVPFSPWCGCRHQHSAGPNAADLLGIRAQPR